MESALRQIRLSQGLTQARLAELAGVGSGRSGASQVSHWETDRRRVMRRHAEALARALGVAVPALGLAIYGEQEPDTVPVPELLASPG